VFSLLFLLSFCLRLGSSFNKRAKSLLTPLNEVSPALLSVIEVFAPTTRLSFFLVPTFFFCFGQSLIPFTAWVCRDVRSFLSPSDQTNGLVAFFKSLTYSLDDFRLVHDAPVRCQLRQNLTPLPFRFLTFGTMGLGRRFPFPTLLFPMVATREPLSPPHTFSCKLRVAQRPFGQSGATLC